MQAITYWVIRYVPDVVRGEFHNIGVVCGSNGGDWAVAFDWRYVVHKTPGDILEWARWFSSQVNQNDAVFADHEFTRAWVEGIRQRQANSIQVASPMPVTAETAREAAGMLYAHLVEHEVKERKRRVTRRTLRSEVRPLLEMYSQEGHFNYERPEVRLGQMSGDFDFVEVSDAAPVIRNVWAFDVAGLDDLERDIQAWNYGVTRLRDDGAVLRVDERAIVLPSNSFVTAIIDPPVHESRRRADIYEATLEAWRREHVDVMTLEQFGEYIAESALR